MRFLHPSQSHDAPTSSSYSILMIRLLPAKGRKFAPKNHVPPRVSQLLSTCVFAPRIFLTLGADATHGSGKKKSLVQTNSKNRSRAFQITMQHHSSDAATTELIRQMIRKEGDYMKGLNQNQANAIGVAQRLAHGGQVESLFQGSPDSEQLLQQLQHHRNKVKMLAETNARHERQVKAYIQGLKELSKTSRSNQSATPELLEECIENARNTIEQDSVEIQQEEMYLKVCRELGEKNNTTGVDDDDICVVPTVAGETSLKCPVTGVLMNEPYRNKICGHVYEKNAILDHLRKDKLGRCPMAGCSNKNIVPSQLEEDTATLNLIRRAKIREQHMKQYQQSSQNSIDMDEEGD